MNSYAVLLVSVMFASLPISLNAQANLPARQKMQFMEQGDRDLRQYEFGGYVNENRYAGNEQNAELVREFLYSHFQSRIKGYIISMSSTLEGEAGYVTYFIEPDEHGVWRIAASYKRELRSRTPPYGVKKRLSRLFLAYTVEKVSIGSNETCVFAGLPPCSIVSESKDWSQYRLRLLDRAGKLLWEI